ncbi:MAG: lysophospholipid acyltransferase family protein [Phyllobacteriaceae bacterium]|nr:lysophospholipid acyltransferase family protein [Phyllobacteriaceae bacterium]
MLKSLVERPGFRRLVAGAIAGYYRLVHRTCRTIVEPADFWEKMGDPHPILATTWHGEHFMTPFAKPQAWPAAAMISRSRDGELNAMVVEKFGIGTIRASGGRDGAEVARRGGVRGFIEVVKALRDGVSVLITADVPKVSRVAGEGLVQIARKSGVPIYPFAAVTSRRRRFSSWDRAVLNLPFGRFAVVYGEAIVVPADADAEVIEAKRLEVETAVNRVTARAYQLAGGRDV